MDNIFSLIFRYPFFLEFTNQNHADGDKRNAGDAHQVYFFDRHAEQTEMIYEDRNEHLSGDDEAEGERNAEARD